MRILSQGSDKGNPINEDLIGASDDAIWLLDGATALGPSRFDGTTEAQWLVEKVSAVLQTATGDAETRLRTAIGEVRAEYETFGPVAAEPVGMPSAGLAMVRRDGPELEIASLADVKVWLIGHDGTRQVIGGGPIEALDAKALEVLRQVQARHGPLDLTAARVHVDPTLKAHRALMNTEGGYWVLSLDAACLTGLEAVRVAADGVRYVLMATDGFYDLWEHYGASFDDVFARLLTGEGEAVVRQLRDIEREDPEGLTHLRFKRHDDASWVLIGL